MGYTRLNAPPHRHRQPAHSACCRGLQELADLADGVGQRSAAWRSTAVMLPAIH